MSDTLTIRVQDSVGATAFATFIIPPAPALAALWPDPLPSGTINVPYSYTLTASGGILPYTFGITAGALPTGLSLNPSTGAITGTPTVSVSLLGVTFSVTDSSP